VSTSVREPAEYMPSGREHLRESVRNFFALIETMASATFVYRREFLRYVNLRPPKLQDLWPLAFASA
jgi:hypothetical protein